MPKKEEFTYISSTGTDKLHACLWLPDEGEPRAVLQLAHGIAEHIRRYDDFACFLAERGFAVAGNDHLGHGDSVGALGCLGRFAQSDGWHYAVEDMLTLQGLMEERFPGVPYFLLGHSMGSFLARTYLIAHPGNLTGCILSGTGWQEPLTCTVGIAVCRAESLRLGWDGRSPIVDALCFGAYNKRCVPRRTKCDWLTTDNAVVDAYMADPKCGFTPTLSLVRDMLGGIRMICTPKKLAAMDKKLPVLLLAGAEDPVGDYGEGVTKTYRALRNAGLEDVKQKLYPADRHEILNEKNKFEVYADILAWLESHII